MSTFRWSDLKGENWKAVLDLYLMLDRALEGEVEPSTDDYHLRDALSVMIVTARNPLNVGEAMAYETEDLQRNGLIYLVERDAGSYFDQIAGYVDFIIMESPFTSPEISGMDGVEFCEWLDAKFPWQDECGPTN